MRFLFGIILGALLTVGAAYIADSQSDPSQGGRMVNWDVVAKNLDEIVNMARDGWKKIAG